MKKFNILLATSIVALLATGCVKPVQETQPVYTDVGQPQPAVYENGQPIVYNPSGSAVYEEVVQPDGTVITTPTNMGQEVGGTTYPDPYANGGTGTVYNDPYASQPVLSDYPVTTPAPAGQMGGIHLQIAALKDYRTAEDYKNRLSLAPGLSAYVQQGAMNKVIVTGIPSIAEANRLKESRFPGAFIVQGATSGGYTPPVQPNYNTSDVYTINQPYGGVATTGNSGIGVQIGAFGSQAKAQAVANSNSGQYPAVVRKIGQYYKVILTGFANRSTAKAHATRVGGFVVSTY